MEELEKTQGRPGSIFPKQEPVLPPSPLPHLEPELVSPQPSVRVPQPRTLDREKMTIEQLLEEAKMLDKTWRYQAALVSYEQVLRRDPGCAAALYGKAAMLKHLRRPKEALTMYDEILRVDFSSVRAHVERGWTLISLRDYEGALATFDRALQSNPSAHSADSGIDFILTHIFLDREHSKRANAPKKGAADTKIEREPCQSARDYFERGCDLFALNRDDEAFRAFTRSLELDPLDLDVEAIMRSHWLCTIRHFTSFLNVRGFMKGGRIPCFN
jgi:tetratricopeptide (TPR) repeat protein